MASVPPSASEHPPTWTFGYPVYHPATREDWRAWLEAHQDEGPGVWVVTWRSSTGRDTVSYDAIVEEALCVGWVDSTANLLDDERRLQLVTPRKPQSAWASSNKARVARLEAEGRMGPHGRQAIEVAKANGWWHILDDVDALLEPADLAASLDEVPAARKAWNAFPPSARKQMLFWVVSAARDDTRRRRIGTIVEKAARGERARGSERGPTDALGDRGARPAAAGFMVFDGVRALTVGDHLTRSSGEDQGQLGPWSTVVSSIGLDPRSSTMKWIFVAYGATWPAVIVAFNTVLGPGMVGDGRVGRRLAVAPDPRHADQRPHPRPAHAFPGVRAHYLP